MAQVKDRFVAGGSLAQPPPFNALQVMPEATPKASEKLEGRDASDEIPPQLNVMRRVDYFPLFLYFFLFQYHFHTFNGARIRRKKEPWVVHPPTQILSRNALTKQPNAYKSRSTSLRCIVKSGGSLISVTITGCPTRLRRGSTAPKPLTPIPWPFRNQMPRFLLDHQKAGEPPYDDDDDA